MNISDAEPAHYHAIPEFDGIHGLVYEGFSK